MDDGKGSASNWHWPRERRHQVAVVLLALLAGFGGLSLGQELAAQWRYWRWTHGYGPEAASGTPRRVPASKMPGPPRGEPLVFTLNEGNAQRLEGANDPAQERWADLAGNYYTGEFVRGFSYESRAPDGPAAWLHLELRGETLCGRLEARRLKPNFAYQIKLKGDYAADPESHRRIGYRGRWRLPGRGTNYGDSDYENYPDKLQVEAYLLFDYLVTDADGNAVRNLALDSSLHVLWSANRQRGGILRADALEVTVHADNPAVYARPKREPSTEYVWAEREGARYSGAEQLIRLPPGRYRAALALTEESFHAADTDGGYWATVLSVPITFEITPPSAATPPAP